MTNFNNLSSFGMLSTSNMLSGNGMYMMDPRTEKAFMANLHDMSHRFDFSLAVGNNPKEIDHLTSEVDRLRLFGKQLPFAQAQTTDILSNDAAKTIGIVKNYGARKNDAAAFIKDSEGFFNLGVANWKNTDHLKAITNAVVETRDAKLAALLIKESGDGWGANTEMLETLLEKSANKMSSVEHNRFIADIGKEYKEVSGGESLNEFLRDNYSVAGARVCGVNLLGTEDKGEEFVSIVNKAFSNNENYNGMGFMNSLGAFYS